MPHGKLSIVVRIVRVDVGVGIGMDVRVGFGMSVGMDVGVCYGWMVG